MKCPFCAETIQEEAILCRFCHAEKLDGQWIAPRALPPPLPKKGMFTIRTAGILFLLSAAIEVTSAASPVPLLGSMRGGALAVAYHLLYVVIFGLLGCGLWFGLPWTVRATLWATAIYTLDRVTGLLDRAALRASIEKEIAPLKGLGLDIGMDIDQLLALTTLIAVVVVACWWGFAAYVYWRRDYFVTTKRSSG